MLTRASQLILFLFSFIAFVRCHSTPENIEIHYSIVDAGMVTDSLSVHQADYKENFGQWKAVYERCLRDSLFHNAFYLGLQENLGIGSISNQTVLNVNRQITVLDTSNMNNIFGLLAVNNSANCFSK